MKVFHHTNRKRIANTPPRPNERNHRQTSPTQHPNIADAPPTHRQNLITQLTISILYIFRFPEFTCLLLLSSFFTEHLILVFFSSSPISYFKCSDCLMLRFSRLLNMSYVHAFGFSVSCIF